MKWPCTLAGCEQDEDCADALGGACGYYGPDEPDVPSDLADDPAAYLDDPPEDEPPEEPWDPQPIQPDEIPGALDAAVPDEYRPLPLSAEEQASRREHVEAARRVHVRPDPVGAYVRLAGEFDGRGRHVGCDGEVGPAGGMVGGCGAGPGLACRTPGGRFIPGFVHPSRLAAERMLFGLDPA